MLIALLIPISLAALAYSFFYLRAFLKRPALPNVEAIVLGAVTDFFDTLGIGSFAPTIAWFKFRRMVEDRLIPSTMIVGHTPPSVMQGFIFLVLLGVAVDPVLLIGCVIATLAGALVGAPIAARSRVWVVQLVVAFALLLAAVLFAMTNLHLMPAGGSATALPPGLTAVAIAGTFVFGLLLNFGIGNYAPTLVMLSLMGMDPRLSFPIMAAAASLAGVGLSIRNIQVGEVDLRVTTGIIIGAIPAVLVAAFVVRDMRIDLLRWLVVVVVVYAALVMVRAALAGRRVEQAALAPAT